MKKALLLSILLLAAIASHAITVKLKITYYDAPVADCDITIKQGEISLGSGRTDANGDVAIEVAVLAGNAIDVYGTRPAAGGEKKWDVKGYVKLDEENFYPLKMEVFVQKMAKGTGMSEASIAAMWGLVLGDGNSAPSIPLNLGGKNKSAPVTPEPENTNENSGSTESTGEGEWH